MQHEKPENPSMMVVEGSVSATSVAHARIAGEADNGLSDRQNAFVDFYCAGIPAAIAGEEEDVPPGNAGKAALAAGYAPVSANNMANRNLLNPKVQDEIAQRVKMGRGSAILAGTTALFRLLDKGTDERAVLGAAVALLDRFGLAPPKGAPLIDNRTINVIQPGEASAVLNLVAQRAAERARQQADGQ